MMVAHIGIQQETPPLRTLSASNDKSGGTTAGRAAALRSTSIPCCSGTDRETSPEARREKSVTVPGRRTASVWSMHACGSVCMQGRTWDVEGIAFVISSGGKRHIETSGPSTFAMSEGHSSAFTSHLLLSDILPMLSFSAESRGFSLLLALYVFCRWSLPGINN